MWPAAAEAAGVARLLATGSRIAYVKLPARGRARPTPVVVAHGGPGVADMAGDAAYFGQLAGDGYDVWVYDQVGTGRSSRLADPRRYDIAREVADLEAIRGRIGADRMVLIGHSWAGRSRPPTWPPTLPTWPGSCSPGRPTPSPVAPRWTRGSTGSTTRPGRRSTAAARRPVRRCTGSASTATSSPSRPRPAHGPTPAPRLAGLATRALVVKGA